MSVSRADIVACARRYLGVRFQHQGRTRAGLDCVGLVIVVAQELGLPVPNETPYQREPEPTLMRQHLEAHLQPIATVAMQPGDILWLQQPVPCHLAILGCVAPERLTLIHAAWRYRRVVEHGYDASWAAQLYRVFAYPGVV